MVDSSDNIAPAHVLTVACGDIQPGFGHPLRISENMIEATSLASAGQSTPLVWQIMRGWYCRAALHMSTHGHAWRTQIPGHLGRVAQPLPVWVLADAREQRPHRCLCGPERKHVKEADPVDHLSSEQGPLLSSAKSCTTWVEPQLPENNVSSDG